MGIWRETCCRNRVAYNFTLVNRAYFRQFIQDFLFCDLVGKEVSKMSEEMWADGHPTGATTSGAYLQYVESKDEYRLFAMDSSTKSNTDFIIVCEGE